VGSIVLRSQTDLAWFALSSSSGWFYEWEYDTLVARLRSGMGWWDHLPRAP
jgi:hypothetical protein